MLKQLPLKKEYLLVAAAILLLLISYQLAFKKTIEAWQLNTGLKHQLAQSTDVSYQPGYLERKNANLSNILKLYKADTVDFRSNIIGTISAIAEKENVKLTGVPTQDPFYHTPQFIIQKLDFEGDYFALIKTLKQLQGAKGIGLVRAVTFKTSVINSSSDKAKKLLLEVYLEMASE